MRVLPRVFLLAAFVAVSSATLSCTFVGNQYTQTGTDAWCNARCNHIPPDCGSYCSCKTTTTQRKATRCTGCWPGTSGVCKQGNSVCWGKVHGRCPTGTNLCTKTVTVSVTADVPDQEDNPQRILISRPTSMDDNLFGVVTDTYNPKLGDLPLVVHLSVSPTSPITVTLSTENLRGDNSQLLFSDCQVVLDSSNYATGVAIYGQFDTYAVAAQYKVTGQLTGTEAWHTGTYSVTTTAAASATCRSWGDPHFTTFDGIQYNYYGSGDFTLFQGPEVAVQVRQTSCGRPSRQVTCNAAIAVQYKDTVVVAKRGKQPTFSSPSKTGFSMTRIGAAYTLHLDNGMQIIIRGGTYSIKAGPDFQTVELDGLCGRFGSFSTDTSGITGRNGRQHGNLNRVPQGHSIFNGNAPPSFTKTSTFVNAPAAATTTGYSTCSNASRIVTQPDAPEPETEDILSSTETFESVTDEDDDGSEHGATITQDAIDACAVIKGAVGQACATIGVDLDFFFDGCAIDYMETGDQSAIEAAQVAMVEQCTVQAETTSTLSVEQDGKTVDLIGQTVCVEDPSRSCFTLVEPYTINGTVRVGCADWSFYLDGQDAYRCNHGGLFCLKWETSNEGAWTVIAVDQLPAGAAAITWDHSNGPWAVDDSGVVYEADESTLVWPWCCACDNE